MRLIRSWPEGSPPDGRAHVVDTIPHWLMRDCSYVGLERLDDDVVIVEWDMAIGREDLVRFVELARSTPQHVLVAPYMLYYADPPAWAHRRWDGSGSHLNSPTGARPVETGDPTCNLFGLGLTYLPRDLIRAFVDARYATHFGDVEFSMWHYKYVSRSVPIAWDVRPVHLHFDMPTF